MKTRNKHKGSDILEEPDASIFIGSYILIHMSSYFRKLESSLALLWGP